MLQSLRLRQAKDCDVHVDTSYIYCVGSRDLSTSTHVVGRLRQRTAGTPDSSWNAIWGFGASTVQRLDNKEEVCIRGNPTPLFTNEIRRHVFHEDGDFVTFYDGYPKATAHVLIVPKLEVADGLAAFLFQQTPPGIGGSSCHMAGEKEDNDKEGEGQRQGQRGSSFQASELLTQDLALAKLARLEAYQGRVVAMLRRLFPRLTFRHGVHAEPSLRQLHVHVISEDFRAAALKNRKHWLSFQPPFLVPLAHVRELVAGSLSGSLAGSGTHQTAAEQQGRLREEVPEEQLAKYLKQCASDGAGANNSELKCCCADGPVFPTIPALKRHLETCTEKRPPWPPPPQGRGGSASTTEPANKRFGAEDADSRRSAKRRKMEEGTSEECDL